MANDKRFIVKNGLQTPGDILIGTDQNTDNLGLVLKGAGSLGSASIDGYLNIGGVWANTSIDSPTVTISNGLQGPLVNFLGYNAGYTAGDASYLTVTNDSYGDYSILNSGQNNGIKFYDNTPGVEILYNGAVDLDFNSTGIDFKREPTYNGDVFWNAGNDGAGSGLDADLIDGLDSTAFVRADQDDTMDGNYIITGNLTVQGTRTEVQSETVLIADNLLTLNSNFTTGAPTENAGWEVLRGDANTSSLQWDETADWFKLISDGVDLGRIITTADEGSGNGFDADTVDGLEGSQFLRSDVDDTAAGNITILQDLTVGDGNGTAFIKMAASGGTEQIAATGGEIGFLGSDFNFAIKVKTNNDIEVRNDIFAERFIDKDAATYWVHPGDTSVLNNIDLEGAIRHYGDSDTKIEFPAEDQFAVELAGVQKALMTSTSLTYVGDIIADKLIDRNNNGYVADPSGTSTMHEIGIDDNLFHNGNTDTRLAFGTDTIALDTDGSTRLGIANDFITANLDIKGGKFIALDDNTKFLDPDGLSELSEANFYSGGANAQLNIGRSSNQRFNILVEDGQGWIKYEQDETDSTDHSVNFQIISSSTGQNRFNFNKDVYTSGNIGAAIGLFDTEVYAPIYYDYNDATYYADFNNTGVSIKAAGQILAGDGTSALPSYSFGSDANTGMFKGVNDRIDFSAGGNVELQVHTTYSSAAGSFRAPLFYDLDNTNYYGNFAATSQMSQIDIDSNIRHRGNTNTYMGFPNNNVITFVTDGTSRLNIDNDSADFSVNVYAPRYYDSQNTDYYADPAVTSVMSRIDIDDYIRHKGDVNTFFGFDGNDQITFRTNNVERLNIDNDSADFTVHTYAPRFFTNDYLVHTGDTNSYIGWDANDSFGVWTGGSKRVQTNDTFTYINQPVSIGQTSTPSRLQYGSVDPKLHVKGTSTNGAYNLVARFEAGSDADDTGAAILVNHSNDRGLLIEAGRSSSDRGIAHLGLLNSSGSNTRVLTLRQDGTNYWAGINKETPTAPLSIQPTGTMGNNPLAASNRLMDFGDSATADFAIAGDASGNAILLTDNNFTMYNTSATGKFAVLSTGDVIVNNDSVTHTASDATPSVGTIANNKLHVDGSVQLNGANDAIVFGTGTSGYLKNNDLGFGQGGGFYMDEATTIKTRGNKNIYTTGTVTGSQFIDANDVNYYADPASTSQMNRIDINDYIRHRGDTNTYIGFDAADRFRIWTGGTQRVNIDNNSADFSVNVYAPRYYDSNDNNYYVDPAEDSIMNSIILDDYVYHNGNTNSYFGWAANNNYKIFTNGAERFNLDNNSADFSVNVYAPRYYDSNDNLYYVDPATISYMNNISFGKPGNGTNTKGRFLSIEGNADSSGEGSARIFFSEHNSSTAAQDKYGMSLAYRGGSATVNSVTGQPVTLTGLSNGEWGLLGYNNSINGNWAMKGPRDSSYVQARGSFRAPIFYDSNNTAYYTDQASTSIHNIQRVNQLQVDVAGRYIDSPSGNYGTIKVEGDTGGWAGYAIRDDWVFMSNGTANAGIYNDTRNEWSLQAQDNSWTRLYANGVHQLSAQNGYGYAPTSMRSPIFYDHDDTTYFGDFASRSKLKTLELGNQGNLTGSGSYPLGIWHNNRYLAGMRNSGAGANYPWLVHDNYNYNGSGSKDAFIVHFNGLGDRLFLDEAGNMLITGEMSASNYNLSAGNENISLNPAYGVGKTELKLFDGAKYWEKRAIEALQGIENAPTGTTAEYVKSPDAPAPSSYVLRTSSYRTFYSDYIEVQPGEEIFGEMYVKRISGSGGLFYYGVERFDKDKKPIGGNTGTTYFTASAQNVTSTSWVKYTGYTTIPTTHTPYAGSDGGGVRYVRMRVLMNHSGGGALREFTPPILMRTKVPSRIRTDEAVYSPIYYDSNDTNFYLDPASTSKLNTVDASNFRDRDNTGRFMNPNSGGNVQGSWNWNNGSIENLNNLSFNDPGPQEGIRWKAGNEWKIYESPNDLATNGGGNLQFTSGSGAGTMRARIDSSGDLWAGRYARAQRFYDTNDAAYYVDPNGTSIQAAIELRTGGLKMARNYTDNAIWFNKGTDANHVLWNHYYGGPGARGAAGSGGFDGIKWNTYAGIHLQGGLSGAYNLAKFHTTGAGNGNAHYVQLYANNVEQLGTRGGYGYAPNSMRSPLFYDQDDTTYYGNFASTSRMNVINANMYSLNDGWDIYDDDSDTLTIRSNNGDHGEIIFRDSGSTNCGRIYFDDDNHWGFKSPDNEWQIYLERNARTILYYNGGQQARTQNGYFEANNQLRTPIFYDSNDTNFYVDPNATSRLRGLTTVDIITSPGITGTAGALRSRDNRIVEPNEDSASQMKFGFTSWDNNNTAPWADYLHLRSYGDSSGGSDNLLMFKKSGRGMRLWQQSFNSGTRYTAYSNIAIYNANPGGGSNAYFYASRYYDSDDTGYYLDPNSNSRIKHLKVAATSANARYDFAALEVRELNHAGAQSANAQTAPRIGFHWGGRVASQIMLETNGEIQIRNNPGTGYEDFRAQIGYFQGDVRSPRYYDSNNTTYYGDFASTSIMHTLDVRSEVYNDGWFRNDTGGRGLYSTPYAMHWMAVNNTTWRAYGGQSSVKIEMNTSGNNRRGSFYANNSNEVGILSQDNGWALQATNGKVDSHHNFYAPIMYDRNDSNYYVDPNSTSRMNVVRANKFTNDGSVSSDDGFGIYWSSDQSPAYAIFRESGGWSNPYPDMRIANHTGIKMGANAGYNGMRFYTDYQMAGQVMSINNSADPLGGGNVYVNNNLQAGTSLRAPIFYDSNNTAYYFNGASKYSTRFEGVNARTEAWLGMPGHTRNSGQNYRSRPNFTGDSNYWTGSFGWGRQDMNVVGTWGSGFIDSWSNPGNQPSGTSHWVGMQASHYRNSNTSGYGWQLVGGPIENLRLRSSWSGWRAWRTVPVLDVNNGNGGSMYAGRYYDSNNTGYYCDPSSFSNFNTGVRATEFYARNWFRNDSSREGIYNEGTGVHAYSWQAGFYAITGNNNSGSMHLQLRAANNGTMCRWMHGDRTWAGDLNAAGQWQLQTRHQDGYSPSLRFIESSNESWTGNIGNDGGKIEYHSNRFYIEAGGNSNRIVQFRRNGSDRSYIDNNGLYVGTATSARWADLAERYTADAIYENATVLGVNLDGDSEATLWQPGMPLLGVISTNPAVQMNDMGIEPGSNTKKAKMNPFIALKGRIPVLVVGDVKKGQWVIPAGDGKAKGVDYGTPGINSYDIIGIALSDSENGEVEVKV